MHEAELTERLNELKTKVNALDDKLGIRQRKFDRAKAAKAARSPRQGTQNTQNSAQTSDMIMGRKGSFFASTY